jgi:hypothetical protein
VHCEEFSYRYSKVCTFGSHRPCHWCAHGDAVCQNYPSVNIDTFVLENNGAEITTEGSLGRILVATGDFDKLFATVIREAPALMWSLNEDPSEAFVRAFDQVDDSIKPIVLQLYHPPLDSGVTSLAFLKETIPRLAPRFPHHQPETLRKLLAISSTNAHALQSKLSRVGTDGHMVLDDTLEGPDGIKLAGLFLFGAMVQHSCDPNVPFLPNREERSMSYKAVRPIHKGEPITFSYTGGQYHLSTMERCMRLQLSHAFLCKCDRCCSPDYTRVAMCRRCGSARPCASTPDFSIERYCSSCGTRDEETGEQESVDHKCLGCPPGCHPHEPVYSLSPTMLGVCVTLGKMAPGLRPALARNCFRGTFPLFGRTTAGVTTDWNGLRRSYLRMAPLNPYATNAVPLLRMPIYTPRWCARVARWHITAEENVSAMPGPKSTSHNVC